MDTKQSNQTPSECTSLIVGRKQMADGSLLFARSEDWNTMVSKNFELYEDNKFGPARFEAMDSPFKCDLPREFLGYSALAPFHLPGHWGSAGFNTAGVGMSATESIFSSAKALAADPLVPEGLAENSVFNIVLPYIHTAREGVERLGMLIEKHGIAEGFGIGFVDKDEIWYLETASGHRWLACRQPEDKYFVTGNQSRFRHYDPKDTKNFLASKDLIEFAQQKGLYDARQGEFDFHEAYIRDEALDHTYNYPRVWGIQGMLSPEIKNDVTKNTFPVYAEPAKKLTLGDVRRVFRFHYNGTEHDPYLHSNPKEPYRPVSIFRTTQTHLLQVQPELPQAVGCINHVCLGMAALSCFLPLFQGVKSYPEPYTVGKRCSDAYSAYWRFRKVQSLGMVDFNNYAPYIQSCYRQFEQETDARIKEIQEDYVSIYKTHPQTALDELQSASDELLWSALDLTDAMVEELFTRLAEDIQAKYLFHGA